MEHDTELSQKQYHQAARLTISVTDYIRQQWKLMVCVYIRMFESASFHPLTHHRNNAKPSSLRTIGELEQEEISLNRDLFYQSSGFVGHGETLNRGQTDTWIVSMDGKNLLISKIPGVC